MKCVWRGYKQRWLGLLVVFLFIFSWLLFYSRPLPAARRRLPSASGERVDHDFPYVTCSLRVMDANVRDVLQAFADKYKLNIVMSEEVKGSVSMIVNDIPVREAFYSILQYSKLGYVKEENVYRIKPMEDLVKEEELKQKTEELTTEVVALQYANAERLVKNLVKFKSKAEGSLIEADKWTNSLIIKDTEAKVEEIKWIISQLDVPTPAKEVKELAKINKIIKLYYINCDEVAKLATLKDKVSPYPQTNSVIITDLPENIAHITSVIEELDKPMCQVLIEAKIIETSKSYSKFLGIQWGGHYKATPFSGKSFPTVSVGGAMGGTNYDTTSSNYAVNLPGSSISTKGPTGAVDLLLGHLQDKAALNMRLSAMEDSGQGRIISQPRITTLDNTEAMISTGETIQLPIASSDTTTVVTGGTTQQAEETDKEAKTELIVKPHVISYDQVKLKICVKRDTADYSRPPVNGVPIIVTRQADTELIVTDGETAVIGGLATTGTSDKQEGIPWLSNIPGLGWLFKTKSNMSEYGELLVFITPHVVNVKASDYARIEKQE